MDRTPITPEGLTSKRIGLYIGQPFKLKDSDGSVKRVVIKKFYKHHVLCLVNGKYYESFSYFLFLTNKMGKADGYASVLPRRTLHF